MKVRDLVEVALLYVGIPAVTLYPLGFVGLLIQLWRDNFFPYYDYDMVWNAVAMIPNTVVVGTGVELLYFSVVSTLLGIGIASLSSKLLRKPPPAGEEQRSTGVCGSFTYSSCCRRRRSLPTMVFTSTIATTYSSWLVSSCSPRGRGFDRAGT